MTADQIPSQADQIPSQAVEIDLREFDRLRDEIQNRGAHMVTFMQMEFVAVGAAVSVAAKLPEALLGASVASFLLWMPYVEDRIQIANLGWYIGTRLAPLLRKTNPDALGWEIWVHMNAPERHAWWTVLTFAVPAVGLMVAYWVVHDVRGLHRGPLLWVAVALTVALGIVTAYRSYRMNIRLKETRDQVRESMETAPAP
jgi:hypothetical protein